ncbi:hypothetical protein [Paenarthrobacter sp. AMU7]|uniref:Uncharacterized protein n=1 Tax=Paenarthrobacter sp. AMU7 TaxID=3162492 RepID=A0AB39YQ12_9MICC
MDALNTGKLGLNNGGCFADVTADGGPSGLTFPARTTVTETGVVFPDGTPLNIGEEFAFGGGYSGDLVLGECGRPGEALLVQSWGFQP